MAAQLQCAVAFEVQKCYCAPLLRKGSAVAKSARVSRPKAKPKLKPKPKPAAGRAASPKPTPPEQPKRPAKPRKPLFRKRALAVIREQLLEHQKELVIELEELEQAAFNASQSEMSGEVSYDEDYADAGSFTFEREKDLSIANNVQDLLDKIRRAIEKVDEGTYGICEVCGNPIEPARLKALPHALLCVKDKAAEERR